MDFGFLGEILQNLGQLGSKILGGNSGLLGGSFGSPGGFGEGFARGRKAVESGGTSGLSESPGSGFISNRGNLQDDSATGGLSNTKAPTNWMSDASFEQDDRVEVEDQIAFNKRWNERQKWTDAQWEADVNPPPKEDIHNPQSSAGFIDGDRNNPALYQPGDRLSTPYPYRRDIPAIDMETKKTIWNGGIGRFNDEEGRPLPGRADFGYYGPGDPIQRGPDQRVEPGPVPQAQIGMQGAKAPGLLQNMSAGNNPVPAAPQGAVAPTITTASDSIQGAPDYRGRKASAAVRYNNPGAMWPGASSRKFGGHESVTLKDGQNNKIAIFPTAIHGAAAQFDLLANKYAGLTLNGIVRKWTGHNAGPGYTNAISRETGLTGDSVVTRDMLQDPRIAIPFAKAMSGQEAGKGYPLSPSQWAQGFEMFSGKVNPNSVQGTQLADNSASDGGRQLLQSMNEGKTDSSDPAPGIFKGMFGKGKKGAVPPAVNTAAFEEIKTVIDGYEQKIQQQANPEDIKTFLESYKGKDDKYLSKIEQKQMMEYLTRRDKMNQQNESKRKYMESDRYL